MQSPEPLSDTHQPAFRNMSRRLPAERTSVMKKEMNPTIAITLVVIVALIAGYFLIIRSDTGSVSGEVAQKNTKKDATSGPSPTDK